MFHFVNPFVFLFLPLPFIVRWILPAWKKQIGSAIYFPMFDKIKSLQNQNTVSRTSYLRLIISVLVWILCVCAAARPQYAGNPIKTTNEGRNLMLVLALPNGLYPLYHQIAVRRNLGDSDGHLSRNPVGGSS